MELLSRRRRTTILAEVVSCFAFGIQEFVVTWQHFMSALLYGRSSCSSPSVFGSKVWNDLIRCKSDGKSQQKSLDLVLLAAQAKKPKRNLIHQNAAEQIYSYLSQKWSHPIFIWGVIPAFLFGVLPTYSRSFICTKRTHINTLTPLMRPGVHT